MNTAPPFDPELHSIGNAFPAQIVPNLTGPFCDLQARGANATSTTAESLMGQSQHFPSQSRPAQNPALERYVCASREVPWNPLLASNPTAPQTAPGFSYKHDGASFSPYSNHAPSEPDTTGPPDSGYGTLSRAGGSVGSGSIHGDCDRFADSTSLAGHPVAFPYDRSVVSPGTRRPPASTYGTDASANGHSNRLVCEYCHDEVKTRSELKYVVSTPSLWVLADNICAGSTSKSTRNPSTARFLAVHAPEVSAPRMMLIDTRKVAIQIRFLMPYFGDVATRCVVAKIRVGRAQTTLELTFPSVTVSKTWST